MTASMRGLFGALLLGAVLVAFTSGSASGPRVINVVAALLTPGSDAPAQQQIPGMLAALLARAPALVAAPVPEGAGDQDVGFVVTWPGSVAVGESGTSDSFAVVLNGRPESEMVILLWSGDHGEVMVSPLLLTFTAETWDRPQTVTVTGVDDSLVDGDQLTDVTVSVASTDPERENALLRLTVEVANADDDAQGSGREAARATDATEDIAVVLAGIPTRGALARRVVGTAVVRPAATPFAIA